MYEKSMIELRTYVRRVPINEFDGLLVKMQTLDDTIADLAPPVFDKEVQNYVLNSIISIKARRSLFVISM